MARDEYDEDAGPVHAEIPTTFRELRACMVCSLVKTYSQFYESGCDNCTVLNMQDNRQRVTDCTTAYFEGMIAMMQPRESWVAKWRRIGRHVPGIYAVSVTGELTENIKKYLEDNNMTYCQD
ncbi:transcription elongation factor SPT4 [Thraustotheca clavata]|uniref:DRB sensitivity-inducing factor small subunit n=1 Tax=Thraustotheca clavata TaxID=74557 RepID=A0A1W0AA13_9STRA|nr:transcription elongation factor SPT4 [Thraustotheca clavata]